MDAYAGLDQAIDTFTQSEDRNKLDDRSTYRLCGIIANLQIKYTNKDNKQFAVFNLATRGDTYEIVMFSDAFERHRSRLENGAQALVVGQTSRRNGETGLHAHEIYGLEASIPRLIQRINFILHPTKDPAAFLSLLRDTIDEEYNKSKNGQPENGHTTEVAVSFLVDGQIVESDSSKALKVSIDGENYQKLRRHPALAGLRIEATPPAPVDNRRPWEKRRAS
jgi:DNA polymerase-3 subunit alpha